MRRSWVAAILFVLAAATVAMVAYVAATEVSRAPYSEGVCAGVLVEDENLLTDLRREWLLSRGWVGTPHDRQERLYPPECLGGYGEARP